MADDTATSQKAPVSSEPLSGAPPSVPTVLSVPKPTTPPTGVFPPGKETESHAPHLSPDEVTAHDTASADKIATEEGDEFWKEYAKEIETELEIKEIGIEKVESGQVRLPEEIAKEMGVKPVYDGAQTSNKPAAFSIRGMSLSDDQLSKDISAKEDTAVRWLAEWFIYQLKKAHYHVKVVKGKVLREDTTQHAPPQKPQILKTSFLGKFKILPTKALGHGSKQPAANSQPPKK